MSDSKKPTVVTGEERGAVSSGRGSAGPANLARHNKNEKSVAKYASDLVKKVNADPGMAELTSKNSDTLPKRITASKQIIDRFLFNPDRVKAILQHFYLRALANDKVLAEYVGKLIPRTEAGSSVTINLNTSILDKRGKTYDIEGKEVEPDRPPAIEMIEAPKVERD